MKPFTRSLSLFTAVSVALLASAPVWALRSTLKLTALTPEGRIAQVTAQLLEQTQFSHERLDPALAAKFLNRYFDSLDGTHEILFQSDTAEFLRNLPQFAEAVRTQGDTHPAHAIFARFLERIEERAAFVTKTLAQGKFDFTAQERFSFDRENAARPRDAAEAEQLWRARLRAEFLQEKLAGKDPAQIAQILQRRYEGQAHTLKKFSADTVLELYLNALAHVYDPHSDYMGHEQLESFNTLMKLSLVGIGATLQEEDGYCRVRELTPGGPAARSGQLKIGDRIVGVSQEHGKDATDLVDMPLAQAVDLIRGPKGTDVTLTIIPALADAAVRKSITIRREEIHLEEQRAKARIVDAPAANGKAVRLGVIDLPGFYARENGTSPSATADVSNLIVKLKKENVRGLILDLRHNGGGSLQEAISLTGLFIPSGPVVQTRDLSGHIEVGDDRDGQTLYDGPLIVLTSRISASASEILAGALQDYGRALIVGDSSTFGKGTVQTMLPLGSIMQRAGVTPASDPGALKVTISKFYRPSGNSTQLRGVRADVVLPSFTDIPEISEAGMKNPLEWDTVPSALFAQFDLVKPYLASLRAASQSRVAADREFGWLHEDLALIKANGGGKSVSINEAERRREQAEATTRNKARHAQLLAHPSPKQTVYEITVKNASAPGLPAPVDAKTQKTKASDPKDENSAAPELGITDDIQLRETQHILADYLELLNQSSALAVSGL